MQTNRPYTLTIAGFDPSSGAGLTADIKTFEQLKVYGLAVCTGLTLQSEDEFVSATWRTLDEVQNEIEFLLRKYPVKAVKFGIVPSLDWLEVLTKKIKTHNKSITIVVDPIWRSTTGFRFADFARIENFKHLLTNIDLLTPNRIELTQMAGDTNEGAYIRELSVFTNVLLKGGHYTDARGVDIFYSNGASIELLPEVDSIKEKHGSGCVLSAAITANVANGMELPEACRRAKKYIETFLNSNKGLLGYHVA